MMKRFFPIAFGGLLLASAAADASPERVRELIVQMEGTDWETTSRAQSQLDTDDPTITLADIESVAVSDRLTADMRVRLEQAALARFNTSTPKGGLGVGFGTTRPGHIQIQTVVGTDAFPASAMLKPGDIIVSVDAKPVLGSAHIRAEILSRKPGEMLPVVIQRDKMTIERELPLGSYGNLTGAARIEHSVLVLALQLRQQRLGIAFPAPDTVGSSIDAEGWINAAFPDGPDDQAEPMDESPMVGMLIVGRGRLVFAGYPMYPRRGKVWSTHGIAQQALLETQRTEISRRISAGFTRRAQLVSRIETVRTIGEAEGTLEQLGPEIHVLQKQLATVERDMHRLTEQLDAIEAPEPTPEDD